MKNNNVLKVSLICMVLLCRANLIYAENIDPDNDDSQYAYGENVGWINFEPNQGPGVHVSQTTLTGFAWAQNIGWINLSPTIYGGVLNDGAGNLSGYAWGENVGWINFDPTFGGVTIDGSGDFDGWAWGENIGWIHFQSASPVAYKVKACVVTLDHLIGFAGDWLMSGAGIDADLNSSNNVDTIDYVLFTAYWMDFCPDAWPL